MHTVQNVINCEVLIEHTKPTSIYHLELNPFHFKKNLEDQSTVLLSLEEESSAAHLCVN
jgi:hypothetical protein